VLDEDPAPPPQKKNGERGRQPLPPPIFGPSLLWPNGCMDQDVIGTEVGLDPGHVVLDGDPVPLKRGAQQPPIFGPCLLWPNGRPS